MKKSVVVILAAILSLPVLADAKGNRRSEGCITTEADSVFDALRPLVKSCRRVGPASARWNVDGNLWNSLSHDQQQQLMDQVATRQAIQTSNVTIHVYAYSTEVGEIGPGWTADWKFRRNR